MEEKVMCIYMCSVRMNRARTTKKKYNEIRGSMSERFVSCSFILYVQSSRLLSSFFPFFLNFQYDRNSSCIYNLLIYNFIYVYFHVHSISQIHTNIRTRIINVAYHSHKHAQRHTYTHTHIDTTFTANNFYIKLFIGMNF